MRWFQRFIPLWLGVQLLSIPTHAMGPEEAQMIQARMTQDIFNTVSEAEKRSYRLKDLEDWARQFNSNTGSFRDLNYVDPNISKWGPFLQLDRILHFAIAYHLPGHPFYQDSRVIPMVEKAIQFWIKGNYQSPNWWMNEIAVPLRSYKIAFLFGDRLSTSAKQNLLVTTQAAERRTAVTGQNLVWYSELHLALGLWLQTDSYIKLAVRDLNSTLAMGRSDGLQVDQTFLQHRWVLYNGGYGANFGYDLSRFLVFLSGTHLSFSAVATQKILDYVTDGQLWMMRGQYFHYQAGGRWFARPGYNATYLGWTCRILSKLVHPLLTNKRHQDLENCVRSFEGEAVAVKTGNKHFFKGDFMIQQESHYSASVKLLSSRLFNADTTPNGEGFLNDYLSDGAQYIFGRGVGDEYKDIFPVFDFRKAPGVTASARELVEKLDDRAFGKKTFVGGASNGKQGVATMDFLRGKLQAKKSWFFSSKGFVALGAGITSRDPDAVWTTLNQTWTKSPVVYSKARGELAELKEGVVQGALKWVHHQDILYVPLMDGSFTLQNQIQSGNWRRISRLVGAEPVQGKVMTLVANHGLQPNDQHYAYAVLPGTSLIESVNRSRNPGAKVLANTQDLQAVQWDDGVMQASFFRPGTLQIGDMTVRVERSCVLQITPLTDEKYEIAVANPRNMFLVVPIHLRVKSQGSVTKNVILPSGSRAGDTKVETWSLN